jgi:hypothetical protein
VFQELRRLGIESIGLSSSSPDGDTDATEYRERVTRRAYEIMGDEGWIDSPTDESPSASGGGSDGVEATPPSAHQDYRLELEI